MNNIIPFPEKPIRRKAQGKHLTSSHISSKQVQSRFGAQELENAIVFHHAPTIFHMEVTIKLTLETSYER